MAISPVTYRPAATYTAPAARKAPAPQGSGYSTQSYGYGYAQPTSGISMGKVAAWAGGAIGLRALWGNFFRNPRGGMLLAVLGGGAFLGNWVYNKLTGRA